jgi:hypothetical protein
MSGSVNRTTQSLDQYLQQKLANLEAQFLQFKNTQPIGADSMPIAISGVTNIGPLLVHAGSSEAVNITFTPTSTLLTLWNFLWTPYVDTYSSGYAFPYGGALSNGQLQSRIEGRQDFYAFNRTINQQMYSIRIENYDTVDHSYYVDIIAMTPYV